MSDRHGQGSRAALIAAVLFASTVGIVAQGASSSQSGAFDQITYRDSGGFAGGGTGLSLTVSGSGNIEVRVGSSAPRGRALRGPELAELSAAVSAVDWPHIEHHYMTPGAADLVFRDLTIVIRGQTFETHADRMAKVPAALGTLFRRLDSLYRQSIGPERR